MAWESRKGKGRYYTRTSKVKGKYVREYIGCGLAGELAAMVDGQERRERADRERAWKEKKKTLEDIAAQTKSLARKLDLLVSATLLSEGFHKPQRMWRRRKVWRQHNNREDHVPPEDQLQWLIQRAERGDQRAIPRLKRFLVNRRDEWEAAECAVMALEQTWIRVIAESDATLTEAANDAVAAMRKEWGRPRASQLDRILTEWVAVSRLEVGYYDATTKQAAEQDSMLSQLRFMKRRRNQAQIRYRRAVKRLTLVRNLLFLPKRKRAR